MKKGIVCGIDVGTTSVRVVVSEYLNKGENPKILCATLSPARGIRHGYVVNFDDAAHSIAIAVKKAEQESGVRIKKAYVAAGGIGLEASFAIGSVAISRGDSEITELDIERLFEVCRNNIKDKNNKEVLHTIPLIYKLDGKKVLGRPIGMKGSQLEAKILFVTILDQHYKDLVGAVEEAGVSVEEVAASPIAASYITLSRMQKNAGCVLANIGAETVSIVVFEDGIPVSLQVFPIGSSNITNDIALCMRVPLEEAEKIKIFRTEVGAPRKRIEDVVNARVSDIFDLIEGHLKKIGKNGLLPAGIIITGGGSAIETIDILAKNSLSIPAKVASNQLDTTEDKDTKAGKAVIREAVWAVAYGLTLLGHNLDDEGQYGSNITNDIWSRIRAWIKQFLP